MGFKVIDETIEITVLRDYDRKELHEINTYLLKKAAENLGGSVRTYSVIKKGKDRPETRKKIKEIMKGTLALYIYEEMLSKYSLDKLSTPPYAELIAAVICKYMDIQDDLLEAIDNGETVEDMNVNFTLSVHSV